MMGSFENTASKQEGRRHGAAVVCQGLFTLIKEIALIRVNRP